MGSNSMAWKDWFNNRGPVGPAWLQSLEYMYPVYNYIKQYSPPPKQLLEVGCGIGDSARALAIMGYTVKAIDNDPHILDMASRHPVMIANGQLHFEYGEATKLPWGFDIATSFGIVEHVDWTERVAMLNAMINSAPLAVVTIPSPILCNTIQRDMGERDISLKELVSDCEVAGWRIKKSFGWGTPPHLNKLRLSLPCAVWSKLQHMGMCSLSFCVIGSRHENSNWACKS